LSESFVAASDGVRLWTVAEGDGPVSILLSNGGAGCCDYLAPLASMLATDKRSIIRWEQRGVGRSGGNPEGPFTIDECLSDMESIRSTYGFERWIVAGHSWGADLSLIYALAHADRCLGLICLAGGRLNNDRDWHAAYDRGMQEGLETQPEYAYPPNRIANRQLNDDYKSFIKRPALLRELAELEVPSLFLYGESDIRPSWAVEQIARLMPAAKFVMIPNADHYFYLSNPDVVRSQVDAFLKSLD
jgi:proline iminopeptidase